MGVLIRKKKNRNRKKSLGERGGVKFAEWRNIDRPHGGQKGSCKTEEKKREKDANWDQGGKGITNQVKI